MDTKKAYALLKKKDLNAENVLDILTYIHGVIDRHDGTEGMPELADAVCEHVIGKLEGFDDGDNCVIYMTAVKAYQYSEYAWRAKAYARESFRLLRAGIPDFKPDFIAERYYDLGSFFLGVSAVREALECFEAAYGIAKSKEWQGLSLIQLLDCYTRLGEPHPYSYTEDEIKKKYPKHSSSIIKSLAGKGSIIRHDPVEHTPEFQAAYDEMSEAVYKKIGARGGMGFCFIYFEAFENECQKRGIRWRPPTFFNPGMRFD